MHTVQTDTIPCLIDALLHMREAFLHMAEGFKFNLLVFAIKSTYLAHRTNVYRAIQPTTEKHNFYQMQLETSWGNTGTSLGQSWE